MGWLSSVGSIVSKAFDIDSSRKLQHDAQDFSADQFARRHQLEVADLKAAGLNPVLSAGGSPSSPTSGIASTGPTQNPFIAKATAAKMLADKKLAEQSMRESRARERLTDAQAESASALAVREQLDTQRKVREFQAVDESEFGRKVMPILESLPSYVRGPIRGLFTTGAQVGNRIADMWEKYQEGKARQRELQIKVDRDREKRENRTLEAMKRWQYKIDMMNRKKPRLQDRENLPRIGDIRIN